MNRKRLKIIIAFLVLLVVAGIVLFFVNRTHSDKKHTSKNTVSEYTHLTIDLSNGKPVNAPDTYLVKPGTGLEFSIVSNVFGKVGVPTNPPETITFTQSPLVFRFKASKTPGTYPLSYQANNSQEVIPIGTIDVR